MITATDEPLQLGASYSVCVCVCVYSNYTFTYFVRILSLFFKITYMAMVQNSEVMCDDHKMVQIMNINIRIVINDNKVKSQLSF
jgi:hypothetical protein